MRWTVTLTCVLLIALGTTGTSTAEFPKPEKHHRSRVTCPNIIEGVKFYRERTWELQGVMGLKPTPTKYHEQKFSSCKYRKWIAELWQDRARRANEEFQNPPHESAWKCIHRYEGSWTDPGSPYYGGLQMDVGFQETYGLALFRAKGTADHWTPMEQMWVAEKAYKTRGFWPWPNTARYCNLI